MEKYKNNQYEVEQEIQDVLSMYRHIQYSLDALSEEEKEKLRSSAKINPQYFRFEGFDLNDYSNEKHFFILKKWINEGEYPELKNRYLNSHSSQTINGYRKMIEIYGSINKDANISLEQLTELAKIQAMYSANTYLTKDER